MTMSPAEAAAIARDYLCIMPYELQAAIKVMIEQCLPTASTKAHRAKGVMVCPAIYRPLTVMDIDPGKYKCPPEKRMSKEAKSMVYWMLQHRRAK